MAGQLSFDLGLRWFDSSHSSVKKTIDCQDCPQGYSTDDERILEIWGRSHLKYFPDHRIGEVSPLRGRLRVF